VPIRPRLLVLSYVCKRWRKLVLETLERIPPRLYLDNHEPTDLMPLVRLIGLCPNLRYLPRPISPWPELPNAPKLEHFEVYDHRLTDASIELLRRSTCLRSLLCNLSALSKLR